ncbi:MAG: hypothetical protein ACPGWR_00735, partial [Ardenticatenaceae bacterium]
PTSRDACSTGAATNKQGCMFYRWRDQQAEMHVLPVRPPTSRDACSTGAATNKQGCLFYRCRHQRAGMFAMYELKVTPRMNILVLKKIGGLVL